LLIGTVEDNASMPNFRVRAFDTPPDLSPQRLNGRRQLLSALDSSPSGPDQTGAPGDFRNFQERAFDLVTRSEARRAFDLGQEAGKVRDRYGRHPLGQNLLLARRLIEAGVRLVNAVAWMGNTTASNATWDMHGGMQGVDSIFGTGPYGLGFALPRLDQAVSALLEDLQERGLLQDTLVVLAGEFGRTGKISTTGAPGRDHWSACYSAMLAGACIRGGTVYGASDKNGAYVKDRPVSPEDFAATLFHALGVPPETGLSRADGLLSRPVSTGQPIADLFG
jgi:hypothetical protein